MRFPLRSVAILAAAAGLAPLAFAKGAKPHSAAVGKPVSVAWTDLKSGTRMTMPVRPVIVDGRRKAWALGDPHDVTDHSFTVLTVQHLNDALPGEKPHFIWKATGWSLVERTTGHVSEVKFAGYDPELSGLSWFRDYAAYCAVSASGKGVSAVVSELGSRKAIARKKLSAWPRDLPAAPPRAAVTKLNGKPALNVVDGSPMPSICTKIDWQREPARVTISLLPGEASATLDVGTGAASSAEDKDE